jgi:asparagine synthase (glutamine-hydrolysing)
MTDVVAHRGPDDFGLEIFSADGDRLRFSDANRDDWAVGLGHRRLSILDLSHSGHQPMPYRNRFWLTYNGEIYNYLEIKGELKALGHSFSSTSDSEVILAAFAEWGTGCFAHFRGMWGLVLFDTVQRRAILSRDRLGIKPLYIWRSESLVAIASEIKELVGVPGFSRTINAESCALYLLTGYENPLGSLFRDVQQVPPGCWQVIEIDSLTVTQPQSYWQPERLRATIESPEEASHLFAEKLRESVKLHLRSDVPIGCALSGGLDSSSIALLIDELNEKSGGTLNTFSAVFAGYAKDERVFMDIVLNHIGAQPAFVTPSPSTFLEDLDRFIWIHDEPTGGFSQYAAYCISRLMRQRNVPVALNGQGGDEVLGGYWQLYFVYLLGLLRQGRLLSFSGHILGSCWPGGNPHLAGQILPMWRRLRTRAKSVTPIHFRGLDTEAVLGGSKLRRYLKLDPQAQRVSQIRELFLPQLLKWDDRNFMAFSVEGRYPFLDHELIELCLRFKPRILYDRGWTKCPLRNGLKRLLPHELRYRRSKFGFETPQDDWLCGSLRPTIEQWLQADRPVWLWVDREAGKMLASHVWASNGRVEELGQMLFRLFLFDRWLDKFNVSCV